MKRRDYLSGLAGIGALSAVGQATADDGKRRLSLASAVGDDTHHPGPPRFAEVGEVFYDRIFTDFGTDHSGGKWRDNFSPQIVGDPQRDAENYSADDFSWSITQQPEGSSAEIEYAPADNGVEQHDDGDDNVAEFAPDVPGTYVLELDAPDGTHEQLIHMFPEGGDSGAPRLELEGEYDSDQDAFVLESNPQLSPDSTQGTSDLYVEWLADDRDALSTEDIEVGEGLDSWTATVPKSALGGEVCRLHAAPSDGASHGVADVVELDPESETVGYPNRPPEWIQDGIMYQIFPRSFEGPPEAGEWPLTNSNANFANMEERLDYIDSLNIDVIWFTPIVPSESGNWKPQNADSWTGSGGNRFKFVGGGPHGYDALSYYDIAEDLGSEVSFEEYKDEPWPWEDGYDPENNLREEARANAMEEFQSFMDAAHDRDIKICFDFVINHGGRHHPFFQDTINGLTDRPDGWTYQGIAENNTNSKYFDWFARQQPAITNGGNVVDPGPSVTGFAGLRVMPQWNYGNVALREHILAAAEHWAEMGVDAFRCDIAYGVPNSFWKEVREAVRAKNSEFMLLDETIPNNSEFAESMFDMHFDTADFMNTAHAVAAGDQSAMSLYDSVDIRDEEGFPEYTLIANATENHDEFRLLDQAQKGGRDDPEEASRAVWAAGVCLPGVPFIYYGQERQITNYGQERFDFNGAGNDNRQNDGDVQPDNYARAFMNWGEEFPQEHLEFFKEVTDFYQETEELKPRADLQRAWFRSDEDVLVFGRNPEDDDTDPVIVIANPEADTAQVDLLPGAETTDMFSGDDISVDSDNDAVTVGVDTLAVVKTDALFSVGNRIAQFDEETGDDNGPGSYTYPTGDRYADGAFDIAEATVHTLGTNYQLRFTIDGNLENPDGNATGVSVQHLQVYMSNPDAEGGATAGRVGTNVTFEAPYQYRVVGHPEDGVVVEDADGNEVATGELKANPIEDSIIVEFPKTALDTGIKSVNLAPLMFGYDGDAEGGVVPVESEAGTDAFGGAENGNAPSVIDAILPGSSSQSDALSYSEGEGGLATIPYTPLSTPFETVAEFSDPAGDNNGPGNYELPTGDFYYEDMADVRGLTIEESRSRTRFAFEMENVDNETGFGLPRGWSHEYFQVYIRDPEVDTDNVAGEVVPSSTEGRTGLNAEFEAPYQYRIAVNGEGAKQVESGDGSTITSDVNAVVDGDTIMIDVPTESIGGSVEGKELAPLVCPFDGFGEGELRAFGGSADTHQIGADNPGQAPKVLDMITPSGVDQSEALSYSSSSRATIPYTPFSQGVSNDVVGTIVDQVGDDYGPGTYEYPTSDEFKDGVYDVTEVDVVDNTSTWRFDVTIDGPLENPYSYEAGFSAQAIQIYVRDPEAGDDVPATTEGRNGTMVGFDDPYHYRVHAVGNGPIVEDAEGNITVDGFEIGIDRENSTISLNVPKSSIGGDITNKELAIMMFSHDGFGTGGIRGNVGVDPDTYVIGLGGAPVSNSPRVFDLVVPGSVADQTEALAYNEDNPVTAPLFDAQTLFEGTRADDSPGLADPSGDGSADDGSDATDGTDDGGDSDDGGSDDGGTTTTETDPTTTETDPATTEDDGQMFNTDSQETTSGDGPGFGVVSGVLGTAGGAAYAAKRLLGAETAAGPDDVDVDVESDADTADEPADD